MNEFANFKTSNLPKFKAQALRLPKMLKTATKTVWFMHTSPSPVVPVSHWQTSATPRSTVLRMSLMRATAHILRFDLSLRFKPVLLQFLNLVD